jgi:hypothetical protein
MVVIVEHPLSDHCTTFRLAVVPPSSGRKKVSGKRWIQHVQFPQSVHTYRLRVGVKLKAELCKSLSLSVYSF